MRISKSWGVIASIILPLLVVNCVPAAVPTPLPPTPTAAPAVAKVATPLSLPTPTPVAKPAVKPTGTLTAALSYLGLMYLLPTTTTLDKPQWSALYDFLIYNDDDDKLRPGLATKWEMSPDAKTWTFQLRKGIQFHEGRGELTAEDVKASLELIMTPESMAAHASRLRATVARMETPEPYTFVVRLKDPQPDFHQVMSSYWANSIVSKKYLEAVGKEQAEKSPIGSGPFKFVERVAGSYIKLEALDTHWRKTAEFKTLIIRHVPEIATRIAALKTGLADIADVEPLNKPDLSAAGFQVRSGKPQFIKGIHLQGLWFIPGVHQENFDVNNPFVKKEVRQALNLAINREVIAKEVFGGEATPAAIATLLPGSPGWNPAWKPYPYDPEKAKKLLADAGYPKGFEVRMILDKRAYLAEMGEAVAMYWDKIGVKVKMEYGTWMGMTRPMATGRKNPGVTWTHRQIYAPNWDLNMSLYWWSKGLTGFTEHPTLEDVMEKLPTVTDERMRAELIRKAGDFVYENYFWVPIVLDAEVFAMSKKVGEWQDNMPMQQAGNLVNFEYIRHVR